jgi:membrane fusion protein, adhesin transport system
MSAATQGDWIDPADADRRGFWFFGHILLYLVAAFVVCFVIWADTAVLDEVTRGQARVIPSSQVQLIQNLEGGILADVMVHEGDIVEKGQVLLRIDNTRAVSDLGDLRQQYLHLSAVIARLEGELAGKAPSEIEFPQELMAQAAGLIEAERAQAEIRRDQLDNQLGILQQQLVQKQQELESYVLKLKNVKKSLSLAQQQLKIKRPLAEQGVISQVELLQAQRDVNELQTELDATQSAIPQTEAQVKEQENRLNEHRSTFRSEAADELSKHRAEFASVQEQLTANTDRVKRTEVTSPMHGTVKEIKIRTIGGVIRPGEDLMEIVPLEDSLLIEARIKTTDSGFVHLDQKAVVKFDTYDYSIYGGLDAVVEFKSSDAIEEEIAGKRERFFRVRLRTDKSYLEGKEGKQLAIGPGDTATVDILTGQKTVLQYLMLPILRTRNAAFTER